LCDFLESCERRVELRLPQHVTIAKPFIGDEQTIARVLGLRPQNDAMSLEEIAAHDAAWRNAAVTKGFDSIVLMTPKAFSEFATSGNLPLSIELNLLGSS
jgi:hypothetical protein